MLGTLAGVSIAFISMRPAAQMWEALWIAFPVLVVILIGFFTDLKLPGNIPVGLAALLLGTAIGWGGGDQHPARPTSRPPPRTSRSRYRPPTSGGSSTG